MKNCDEMVNSLLERREQYAAKQKRKKKSAYPYSNLDMLYMSRCLIEFPVYGKVERLKKHRLSLRITQSLSVEGTILTMLS